MIYGKAQSPDNEKQVEFLLKKNIVFVILNYNVYDMVLECVDSIQKHIDTDSYAIVIVDNPAQNPVGERLKLHYTDNHFVDVILMQENCGFARGNNVGINFARKSYNPDFIVCLNNDTLLEQTDFYKTLNQVFKIYHPAVIGPQIILRDNSIQPVGGDLLTKEDYQKELQKMRMIMENCLPLKTRLKEFLLTFRLVRFLNLQRHKAMGARDVNTVYHDLILHGCCLIFTNTFFEQLNGFHPGTFLFREEELLFLMLKKKGLHNLYCPSLSIRHLEDVSTDSITRSSKEKRKFLASNQIDSLQILIKEMD